MSDKCCACSKAFQDGDEVLTFYIEKSKRGSKSGMIGFYSHPNYPKDYIDRSHFTAACLEKCFSPADNPFLYDTIVAKIRAETTEDIRQEIYDDMDLELDDEFPDMPDIDDPPFCLWCKGPESVWVQIRSSGYLYACTKCNKYWDQDENEIDLATGQAA
jgi:hypothetical protein